MVCLFKPLLKRYFIYISWRACCKGIRPCSCQFASVLNNSLTCRSFDCYGSWRICRQFFQGFIRFWWGKSSSHRKANRTDIQTNGVGIFFGASHISNSGNDWNMVTVLLVLFFPRSFKFWIISICPICVKSNLCLIGCRVAELVLNAKLQLLFLSLGEGKWGIFITSREWFVRLDLKALWFLGKYHGKFTTVKFRLFQAKWFIRAETCFNRHNYRLF